MPAELDILRALKKQQLELPPLMIRLLGEQAQLASLARELDAIVEVSWKKRAWKFAAEIKRLSTPKTIQTALNTIQPVATQVQLKPMIIVPYLSRENIRLLESKEISGIDLCGNGIVIIPNELLVVRTGQPNRFPQSDPIRNVYRGDSSLVARAFLAKPKYRAVGEIAATIQKLGGDVTLPTVSKVLKTLEGDLIVAREAGEIRLLQPDKLLGQLTENYRPPKIRDRYLGKVALNEAAIPKALVNAAQRTASQFVLTGAASASEYAVMAREPIVAAYCRKAPEELLDALDAPYERTDRFPNFDLTWTDHSSAYFDSTLRNGVLYASPVQAYLELMSGDKRQRETAEQVREYAIQRVQRANAISK